MKVYTVYIESYETDNPCATYDYSTDYLTFEEAQEALEKKLWELETGKEMSGYKNFFTKRDARYNCYKHCFEEYEGARYIFNIKITDKSFQIGTEWSDFSGAIVETEIEETPFSLPTGHWRYIDEHGVPKEKGVYLISSKTPKGNATSYSYFDPEMRNVNNIQEYCEGFFDNSYMEHECYNVYAWTETIEPAQRR